MGRFEGLQTTVEGALGARFVSSLTSWYPASVPRPRATLSAEGERGLIPPEICCAFCRRGDRGAGSEGLE